MPTVHVSLVREHTAAIQPPRALWVPFMLGRPLGAPNDAAFQRRVILAALRLLERERGPVLEDFPEDAPDVDATQASEQLACPVSFAPADAHAAIIDRVVAEIGQLQVWHDMAVENRGRTSLGLTSVPMEDLAKFIASWAGGGNAPPYRSDCSVADALRLACEDLKTFYMEARAAQPGRHTGAALRDWFWRDTQAARLLFQLHDALLGSSDAVLRGFAENSLIPRSAARRW